MFIKKQKQEIQIPLNDINVLILDNPYITITADCITNLSYHNIIVLGCNCHHLPNSCILPINAPNQLRKIIQAQIKMKSRLRGLLWKKIIKRKIINQARNLKVPNLQKVLIKLARQVKYYDVTHREAYAARIYFCSLFGKNFQRRQPSLINSALNYTYALVRSMIARSITAYGLLPCYGIWHHNQFDNFALADDLIEPFRAIADNFVIGKLPTLVAKMRNNKYYLTKNSRIQLLHFLNIKIRLLNHYVLINNAVDIMVHSFQQCCLSQKSGLLILPTNKILVKSNKE